MKNIIAIMALAAFVCAANANSGKAEDGADKAKVECSKCKDCKDGCACKCHKKD